MQTSLKTCLQQGLQLCALERIQLAQALMESLHPVADPATLQAWQEEVALRWQAVQEKKVALFDGPDLIKSLYARLDAS